MVIDSEIFLSVIIEYLLSTQVSFGSLIGFLPYRNLGAKWKFLAFESWLRKRGLDPSLYRRNLSIVSNYPVQNQDLSSSSNESQDHEKVVSEKLGSEMKFEDLLQLYDQEKTKFLSSFVGQVRNIFNYN